MQNTLEKFGVSNFLVTFALAITKHAFAEIAQLVERNLAKVEVASSRLVSRSRFPGRRAVALLFYWTEFFEPKKRCFLHEVLQGIWYNPPLAVLSI